MGIIKDIFLHLPTKQKRILFSTFFIFSRRKQEGGWKLFVTPKYRIGLNILFFSVTWLFHAWNHCVNKMNSEYILYAFIWIRTYVRCPNETRHTILQVKLSTVLHHIPPNSYHCEFNKSSIYLFINIYFLILTTFASIENDRFSIYSLTILKIS